MAKSVYPKYKITRTFGVSSLIDGYEYRRIAVGEFGERSYKSFRLTAASHRRVFALIKSLHGFPGFSGDQTKGVTKITHYDRILGVGELF